MAETIEKKNNAKPQYLVYRGKPLVREKNAICYGSMEDKHILFMLILSMKKAESFEDGTEVPDAILVQILSTDTSKPAHERVVKQFNKNGLYDAMDIGLVWLDKLNEKE